MYRYHIKYQPYLTNKADTEYSTLNFDKGRRDFENNGHREVVARAEY